MIEINKNNVEDYINNKLKSSIIGFVVGDALGVPVEFMSREQLKNNKITNMEGYGTHYQPKGTWSDDTSMLLATMDAFCNVEGDFINNHKLYQTIMNNFASWKYEKKYTPFNQVFDIGIATSTAIDDYRYRYYQKDKTYRANNYNNVNSNGNGSLMRILPIAINLALKDGIDSNVIDEVCYHISSLTHAHYYSIFACHIFVRYIIELLKTNDKNISYLNTKKIINDWLNQNPYGIEETKKLREVYKRILESDIEKVKENDIKSSGFVVDTLEAVLWTILNTNSFEDAVLTAVNLGDDTDTVGAIVGSIAGILYGYNNIPTSWINDLQSKEKVFELTDSFIEKVLKSSVKQAQNEKNNQEQNNSPTIDILEYEKMLNLIYPGLRLYARDVDMPLSFLQKYKENVGRIIYERAFVDCTKKIGGLIKNTRYLILSNRIIDLSHFEDETDWGLCVANNNSAFKIMTFYEKDGKNLIVLLHIPTEFAHKFEDVYYSLDKDLIIKCINRFEADLKNYPLDVHNDKFYKRLEFPVGMSDDGEFFEKIVKDKL